MYYQHVARLAQSVERKALNLVVVGSSPTVGVSYFFSTCNFFNLTNNNQGIGTVLEPFTLYLKKKDP
jgi:hypothetical protein